jgi:hypothetical protein
MWSVENVLNGMKILYSPWIYFYSNHTYKIIIIMNGIGDEGPRSKVQWNGEIVLGWNHKLNKSWHLNKNPKNKLDQHSQNL